MKKLFMGFFMGVAALVVAAAPAWAKVDRVGGAWDLTGTYTIEFTCTAGCSGVYPHEMTVTSMDMDTGDFSGNGHYVPNPNYKWDVSGTVSGDDVDFHLVYTGLNPGYWVDVQGQIAPDGSMSGTAQNGSQSFDWQTTDGAASRFEGNHGQYVRMSDDKQEAAHSRVGMPVQSKGHSH